LAKGDKVALIRNAGGVDTSDVTQTTLTGYQGISLKYDFTLANDNGDDLTDSSGNENLYAVVGKAPDAGPGSPVQVQKQTKAPVEGRAAELALLTQGGELATGAGMAQAVQQAELEGGLAAFGAIQGGHSKYATGSHIRVNAVNLIAGVANRLAEDSGALTLGGFLEGGWGSHKTYNTFNDHDVRGDGNARYFGIGALGKQQWDSGLHAEAALRVGRGHMDWQSDDLIFAGKQKVHGSYSTSGTYVGAELGLGYTLQLSEQTAMDIYGQYHWNHQSSDSATIAGDKFKFDSMDSHRTRLGLRVSQDFSAGTSAYAGLAWDHEFDGKAKVRVHGLRTP